MNDPFKGVINCAKCGAMNDQTWTACCECGATPLEDAEGYDPSQHDVTPAPKPPAAPHLARVLPHTHWQHYNGTRYTVIGIANVDSTNPAYVETVVYCGHKGKLQTRPLSDWHRSMTHIG